MLIKPLNKFKTMSGSYMLIEPDNNRFHIRSLFKYMDLETALICLKNGNIRFVQPDQWPDKYESHFYSADFSSVTSSGVVTPRLWACCFTANKMSEASWNTYRYNKQGLGCRCVKLQISRKKFRSFLRADSRVKSTYEGFMDYSLTDFEIQNIHKKSSCFYNQIFKPHFDLSRYLSLLLIKRQAFNYENEFRFLVTSDEISDTTKQIFINVQWANIIEAVEVDKFCTDTEIEILKKYLYEAGVDKTIIEKTHKAKLYDDPAGTIKIE